MSADSEILQRIFEQSEVGLYETNAEGQILLANPALARIFGFPDVETLMAEFRADRAYADAGARQRFFKQLQTDGGADHQIFKLLRKNDGWLWASISARLETTKSGEVVCVGSLTDVTELVEARNESQATAQRFKNFYDRLPIGIYRIGLDGEPVCANPYQVEMFGYADEADWIRRHAGANFYVDPSRREVFLDRLSRDGVVRDMQSEVYRAGAPGSGTVWISEFAYIVDDETGDAKFIEGLVEDITARRLADDLRERAEQADRANELKSEFLASMSHELRTPLNGVIGAAHVLAEKLAGDEHSEMAELIVSSGESLLSILNDILDLAKVESGSLELDIAPFEPARLVREAIEHWRPLVQDKPVNLAVDIAPGLPGLLMGDARRVRQILWNYLSNALKHTESGEIRLRVDHGPDGACSRVRFTVSDTGRGLPAQACSQVFDKFYQVEGANGSAPSTGLGLAICREFAELMGGEVGCSPGDEGGAVFWFETPFQIVRDQRANTREIEPASDETRLEGLRVLAAEDNLINQRVLSAILEGFGCRVSLAGNGAEALDQLTMQCFDIVLMDIQMPVMDGIEAVHRIRRLGEPAQSGIPVIALTANAMRGDRERYLQAGMDDFVSKPIEPDTLKAALLRQTSGGVSASRQDVA